MKNGTQHEPNETLTLTGEIVWTDRDDLREFQNFQRLTAPLLSVPKDKIDAERAKEA